MIHHKSRYIRFTNPVIDQGTLLILFPHANSAVKFERFPIVDGKELILLLLIASA